MGSGPGLSWTWPGFSLYLLPAGQPGDPGNPLHFPVPLFVYFVSERVVVMVRNLTHTKSVRNQVAQTSDKGHLKSSLRKKTHSLQTRKQGRRGLPVRNSAGSGWQAASSGSRTQTAACPQNSMPTENIFQPCSGSGRRNCQRAGVSGEGDRMDLNMPSLSQRSSSCAIACVPSLEMQPSLQWQEADQQLPGLAGQESSQGGQGDPRGDTHAHSLARGMASQAYTCVKTYHTARFK